MRILISYVFNPSMPEWSVVQSLLCAAATFAIIAAAAFLSDRWGR